jgi:hypothetical protein
MWLVYLFLLSSLTQISCPDEADYGNHMPLVKHQLRR